MKWTILLIGVIAACFGFMMFGISSNSSEYGDFSIARNNKKEIHVVGEWVQRDKAQYDPIKNPNLFTFYLKDEKQETSLVVYKDTKPVGFEESQKVVVIGSWSGDHFEASKIMMKCPSKYNDNVKVGEN